MTNGDLLDRTGKRAVVTGSHGLSRRIILVHASQGADVATVSRMLGACEKLTEEVMGQDTDQRRVLAWEHLE